MLAQSSSVLWSLPQPCPPEHGAGAQQWLCPCLLVGLLWAPPSQPTIPMGTEPRGGLAFPLLPPPPLATGKTRQGLHCAQAAPWQGRLLLLFPGPAPGSASLLQSSGSWLLPGPKAEREGDISQRLLEAALSWHPAPFSRLGTTRPGRAAGSGVERGTWDPKLLEADSACGSAPLSPGGSEPSAVPWLVPGMGGISQGKKAKAGDENRSQTPAPPCSTPRLGSQLRAPPWSRPGPCCSVPCWGLPTVAGTWTSWQSASCARTPTAATPSPSRWLCRTTWPPTAASSTSSGAKSSTSSPSSRAEGASSGVAACRATTMGSSRPAWATSPAASCRRATT